MSESQITTLDNTEAVEVAASKTTKTKTKDVAKVVDATGTEDITKYFNVTVHPTGDDSGSDVVDISVNGYLTRLPRGVPCKVSEAVLHVLENAIVTSYRSNGDSVVARDIQRFPFSATPA